MNLLTMRQSFASGMPIKDVSQKMQFHHAAAPSLEGIIQRNSPPSQNPNRHFQNPNIFNKNNLDKDIPSNYKSSSFPEVHVEEELVNKSSVMIPENAKHIDTDDRLMEETPMETVCENESPSSTDTSFEMEVSEESEEAESEMSDSDDDFIVFETGEGPCEEENSEDDLPVNSTYDCDSSSDDDESGDENWENKTMVFHNSKRRKEREVSISASEDSFIVFDDEDTEESPEKKKKSKGKKVTFAKEPDLSTVHVMIKWSFAYRKARKGIWEQYARDNERFRFRVSRCADTLNECLHPKHRQKIYEERFKERPE